MTPTILRSGPYRFFFYSSDRQEPPHVHVERDSKIAKFWLEPLRIENGDGFGARELTRLTTIVRENHDELLKGWHEFFTE